MPITVEVKGLKEILERWQRGDAVVGGEFEHGMQNAVDYAVDYEAKYPPEIPGSSYIRTTRLGKSWTREVHVTTSEVWGKFGNITPYMEYVQDEVHQAKVHRGRWPTIQDITEEGRAPNRRVVGYLRAAIQRVEDWLNGK